MLGLLIINRYSSLRKVHNNVLPICCLSHISMSCHACVSTVYHFYVYICVLRTQMILAQIIDSINTARTAHISEDVKSTNIFHYCLTIVLPRCSCNFLVMLLFILTYQCSAVLAGWCVLARSGAFWCGVFGVMC